MARTKTQKNKCTYTQALLMWLSRQPRPNLSFGRQAKLSSRDNDSALGDMRFRIHSLSP